MRVLCIEIHGFKSFAQPVRLEFDAGIAGIVGPNGSGKSNLVEAVRWVLGEQSLSQLRGKRTEDVIWAGTKGRAPAGMAEVSITFDNSDRSLPIDFSEVTITRRAYRSGENEYMINRSRVRLRDVSELVSAIGQGYTVVSQGTADAALALTPEGRRGLFEEAADITQHYARRDDALRRLAEMEANSTRVADVLAELGPRLRTLARQARQAREREAEETKLRELLLAFYSRELARSEHTLARADEALRGATERVERIRVASEQGAGRERALSEERDRLEEEMAGLESERTRLGSEEQAAARSAIAVEGRAAALDRELNGARARLQAATETCLASEQEYEEATRALTAAREAADQASHDLRRYEQGQSSSAGDRTAALRTVDELRHETYRSEAAAARARNQVTALQDRLAAVEKEHSERLAAERELEASLQRAEQETSDLRQLVAERTARRRECAASVEAVRAELRALSQETSALSAQVAEKDASLREQRTKLRLLEDLQESGAGLSRAAQVVLKASAAGRLPGIVGTLGSLLDVPARYEHAVEAVLGAALQNIVTEEWRNAEEAIALLKRSGAGRVTFLPLDTMRPPSRPSPPTGAGIIGLAADLVGCEERARPALLHSLGRVLIVEDLPTARSLVARMGGLSAIVTLGGETLRPGGALTGGGAVRESGVLARGRELRELPLGIERLERERRALEGRLQAAQARRDRTAALERARQAEREAAEKELRAAQAREEEARRALERAGREREWLAASAHRVATERDALRSSLGRAEQDATTTEAHATDTSSRLSAATTAAATLEQEARAAASRHAELRTAVAVGEERLRAAQRAQQRAYEMLQRARNAVAREQDVQNECGRRAEQVHQAAAEARTRQEELSHELNVLDARLAPHRESLHVLRRNLEAVRAESARISTELLRAEEERLATSLELERARDAHRELLERAARETGAGETAEIPRDLAPPPDVEQRIRASADRLARIGPVNALATREHEELRNRAEFMEQQLADIQTAQADLHKLITSLEEQMERRFSDTFSVVSERFGANFRRLFGGGSAELALVTKGDSVGVEIRAQPPGKRLGSLSLLSGGERALTSCALLFALIQAGGAPFCVLDEVDAALDESNVGRFCDLLHDLARDTQFIVVTHNRGTIERASTLYGVSMETSGISKMLSLRLDTEPTTQRATA